MKYDDFEILDGTYELSNGTTVKVWTQQDGQWACAAKDHGPFCRRCQHLQADEDQIAAACLSQALDGLLEMTDDPKRGWLYRVTPTGEKQVERILARDGLTTDDMKSWTRDQLRAYLNK